MRTSWSVVSLSFLGVMVFTSCSGSSGGDGTPIRSNVELVRVDAARLVDVYGIKRVGGATVIELYEHDVLAGSDITDERDANSRKRDSEVQYDFFGVDPDTLQSRLLIPREIGSEEFQKLYDALDDNVAGVTPGAFGRELAQSTYSVVARNAAIRLTFDQDLGLSEEFFLAKDVDGNVQGIANPRAVQLCEIVGDPNDNNPVGDFRLIPTRIVYKGNQLILDPVFLGREGTQFGVANNASGMPESQNSTAANMRIALLLESGQRIRGLVPSGEDVGLISTNLEGQRAIVRDFRSANARDEDFAISNGFVRDTTPLRLVGQIAMRLERVDVRGPLDQRLVLYKAGAIHEIDRGDVIRLYDPAQPDRVAALAEVIVDPEDDRGAPEQQHVVVRVRDASPFAPFDPSGRADYPTSLQEREPWLVANAPLAVLATEFHGEKDQLAYFAAFSPSPVPDPGRDNVEPNRNISPFAAVSLQFSKPVDRRSLRGFDSWILSTTGEAETAVDAKRGTAHLIASSIQDEDGSQTAFRSTPIFGLYLDDAMRAAGKDAYPYWLHLVGGLDGIRDLAGNAIDFQFENKSREFVSMPFYLDLNVEGTRPRFPNNRIVTIARRMKARDEDESRVGLDDAFGAATYQDGRLTGRPTTRVTSYHDDRNQLPSPPNPPLAYCADRETLTLTAATPFPQPIQNPLNPHGCRLQTVWREVDLSFSRTNPFDMNLDVEAMWWAPFQASSNATRTEIDVFDSFSLDLAHSERRPSNCVRIGSSLPLYPTSDLYIEFWENFLRSKLPDTRARLDRSKVDERQGPHTAFRDQQLTIAASQSVFEPNNVNRYNPLPVFQRPYFTWRDERLEMLGGGQGDARVLSPFKSGFWNNARWHPAEDGQVGAIALPLLADFFMAPDSADLPKDDPFLATGVNGWQVSLVNTSQPTVTQPPRPRWRVYSAGYVDNGTRNTIDPKSQETAIGGWDPTARARTWPGDPVSYWARFDFLKRQSVMTWGFVDLRDPHNDADNDYDDPRLGPFVLSDGETVQIEYGLDPSPGAQPGGTKLTAEFRGADEGRGLFEVLDPTVSGEAHVRTIDNASGTWRNYLHTQRLTRYTKDPSELFDSDWLRRFRLMPTDVRLLNFRLVFENNIDVTPAVAPSVDSFWVAYRIVEER